MCSNVLHMDMPVNNYFHLQFGKIVAQCSHFKVSGDYYEETYQRRSVESAGYCGGKGRCSVGRAV